MPNEDSNVTGMTQTSSAQIWDENDFVLDFWDGNTMDQVKDSWENSEEHIDVDVESEENKNVDSEDEMDKDSNQDDFLDENVESQEEKVEETGVDLDNDLDDGKWNESEFDFSLDDDENSGDKSIDFEENDVNDLDNIDEKNDNMEENVKNLDGSNENLWMEVNLEDESVDFTDNSPDNNSQDGADSDNVKIEDLDKLMDDAQTEGKSDGKDSEILNDDVQPQDLKSEETDFGDLFDDNSEDVKDDKDLQEKKLDDSSNTTQEEDLFSDENSENLDDEQLQDSNEANEENLDNDFNVEVNDNSNQWKLEGEWNKESDLDVDKVEGENDDFFWDWDLFQGESWEVDSEKGDGALQEKKIEDDNFDKVVSASDNEDSDILELEVDKESMDVLDNTQSSENSLHEDDSLQNEKKSEDSDYDVNSKDLDDEYVKQPDMMDLLWGGEVDFSESDTVNQKQWVEVGNSSDVVDESAGLNQLDSGTLDVRGEGKEVNKDEGIKDVEKSGFVMDLSSDDRSNLKTESDIESGKADISDNLSETQSQVDLWNTSENVVNQNVSAQEMSGGDSLKWNSDILNSADTVSQSLSQNKMEDLNKVEEVSKAENIGENKDVNIKQQEGQEIKSTLSLDQIVDSEVNNNLQFVDSLDNKVVSNDSSNSWSSRRKKVVLVAGIWMFLLAGLVFVLAFPSNVFERKPWDVFVWTGGNTVEIWDENEEIIDENEEVLWHGSSEDSEEQDDWLVSSGSMAGSSIMLPEDDEDSQPEWLQGIEWDIEIIGDDIEGNPEPYLWEDLDDEEPVKEEKVVLEKDYIISAITDYKSQVERYRSIWYNELQDKKYIMYAVQAIHLCEVYQQQVESWEWLDEDSFKKFELDIKSLLSNLVQYIWWEEVETFIQPNFNEEYDFEGKDEVTNYVYERSKTSTKK